MLAGGLAGGYAGSEIAKANAQELTVALDNGENVVVVIKGNEIQKGERVQIIKDGNKVASVTVNQN
jgi:outer membrane lipoprotein SlyB